MSTPSHHTLLLDMDGVLAEVSKSYRSAILSTCHHYKATSISYDTISDWKARGGCNNDWVLSLDLINSDPNGQRDLTLDQVTQTFETLYQGDPATNTSGLCELETLIPTMETMKELNRRIGSDHMAIVTGRPRSDCMKFLSQYNLTDLFDVCVCMEDGPPKPDPFPLQKACELLKVEPSSGVIMVGDTPDDIRAAVACGCMGVGVATPENAEKAKEEGRGFDTCKLTVAMKGCGAELILEPGFEKLIDLFPENRIS